MPTTPEGLQTVTLVGQYVLTDDAGTAQAGSLTFTPSPNLVTFPDQNVMVTGTQTVNLDSTGSFTLDLVCTDTANQNPSGWTYAVVEKIVGNAPRNFNIFLPYTVSVINLADITPTNAGATYLPVVGPMGPGGVVTYVNGKTGSSITLTPADVSAVATSALGAASGVAQLDSGSHVVAGQLAFASATPSSVATAGAVGVGTLIARHDHTHSGVDLSSAQTVAGIKTFSVSPIVPDPTTSTQAMSKNYGDTTYVALTGAQTVAGVKTFSSSPIAPTPTTASQVSIKSYTDGAQTFTGTKAFTQASGSSVAFTLQATADTFPEFQAQLNGILSWGSGAGAADTNLYRAGVSILQTDDAFVVNGSTLTVTRGSAVSAIHLFITGDTVDRLNIRADGQLAWGPGGSAAADVILSREASNQLATTDAGIRLYRAATGSSAVAVRVAGDSVSRWSVTSDGIHQWGPGGSGAFDLNLYRASAGLLKTDNSFKSNVDITAVGNISAANFPSGAWTAFTPTWSTTTGSHVPSIGNGTLSGRYMQVGKTVYYNILLTAGSTTSYNSGTGGDNFTLTLPVTASASSLSLAGTSHIRADGSDAHSVAGIALFNNATSIVCFAASAMVNATAMTATGTIDATTPIAWTTAAVWGIQGVYEAA